MLYPRKELKEEDKEEDKEEEKVLHPRREVVFPSFLFAHVLTIQIDKTRTLDKLKSFFSKNFHRA